MAVAMLVGLGGTSLVAISLGEGNRPKAQKILANVCVFTGCLEVIVSVLGYIFLKPLLRMFGTPDGEIYGYELSGWDSIMARISQNATDYTVKNLTYCGGHNVRGDGYSSAYITGESAANTVIRRLKGGN